MVIGNGVSANFRPQSARRNRRHPRGARPAAALFSAAGDIGPPQESRRRVAGLARALPDLPDDLHLVVSGNIDRRPCIRQTRTFAMAAPRMRAVGYVAEEHMAPLWRARRHSCFLRFTKGSACRSSKRWPAQRRCSPARRPRRRRSRRIKRCWSIRTSVDDIARGIVEMSRDGDLRARLAAEGPAHAAKFTWDDVARATSNCSRRSNAKRSARTPASRAILARARPSISRVLK